MFSTIQARPRESYPLSSTQCWEVHTQHGKKMKNNSFFQSDTCVCHLLAGEVPSASLCWEEECGMANFMSVAPCRCFGFQIQNIGRVTPDIQKGSRGALQSSMKFVMIWLGKMKTSRTVIIDHKVRLLFKITSRQPREVGCQKLKHEF